MPFVTFILLWHSAQIRSKSLRSRRLTVEMSAVWKLDTLDKKLVLYIENVSCCDFFFVVVVVLEANCSRSCTWTQEIKKMNLNAHFYMKLVRYTGSFSLQPVISHQRAWQPHKCPPHFLYFSDTGAFIKNI